MSHRPIPAFRPLILLALLLASLLPITTVGVSAQSDRGLIDETSYQSPQFGYTVSWGSPWEVRDRDVLTNPGGFDTITLRSLDGVMRVSGRAETYDPLTFLQDTIAIQLASGGEVINLDSTAAVPTAELQIGLDRMRLDVISLPESGAIVLLSLRADERDYDTALASAEASIQVAGTPVFSSAAVAPTTEAGPTDTPSAQQAAPTEASPTSTQVVLGGGVEGSTYTSPNFGFSIEWDPSVWALTEEAEYSEPDFDVLELEAPSGFLWITGWRNYNGNASTCLLGEQTYFNDPDAGITEWEVAVDAEGNELTGSEEGRAWGVYTNVYTDPEDPAATPISYVDYIECVSLGDGESVVIIYAYAERDFYNEHIEHVRNVSDSLQLPEGAPEPISVATTVSSPAATPTEAPVELPSPTETAPATTLESTPAAPATAPASSVTDLTSGDSVNGETYAYALSIPAGWQASESSLGGEVERTVLSNGTSTVAVEARAMSVPTLSDCVTNVAGEHEGQAEYGDLALARTASGDAFSGDDDFSAFANFTFTGPDDETWAHFIECRWIVEGESVLVVVQDVSQDLFGSERAARRQIQNSIEIGP